LANALVSNESIFHMVENAYKVTLVTAFIPLLAGLYWKRANIQGALFSTFGGMGTWLLLEVLQPSTVWPPQLLGLLVSAAGMIVGSVLQHYAARPKRALYPPAQLDRHAAAQTHHVAGHAPPHEPNRRRSRAPRADASRRRSADSRRV